ncbi:hypothetical protein AB4Y32_39770 [Paraburkholderia phymatum]|uniref:Uncharacterized protein n=1 Tax=Paraburkholderia phymatum TaxID=148447 RepID=A0ACC6UDH8_9BURK
MRTPRAGAAATGRAEEETRQPSVPAPKRRPGSPLKGIGEAGASRLALELFSASGVLKPITRD